MIIMRQTHVAGSKTENVRASIFTVNERNTLISGTHYQTMIICDNISSHNVIHS